MPFVANPWKHTGYQPPSKCPSCKRLYTLTFKGTRTKTGDHIYQCTNCNTECAAPTIYATCKHYGDIEKDVFYTPCTQCPNYTPIGPPLSQCQYFNKQDWYGDLSPTTIKQVEESIKRRVRPKEKEPDFFRRK